MDLSKAFDTLNHNLLIAKLGSYGFETDALRYMKSYLTNRKQRVRVNKTFSEWEKITIGVPQGSMLRPLLFNIFLNDHFIFISNSSLSNYADDNTLYTIGDNLKRIKNNLRNSFDMVHRWFYENYMVLMPENIILCFLGITLKMKHSYSITSLRKIPKNKKSSQKTTVFSRLSSYLHNSEKKLIFYSMTKSQFSYYPLVWMFYLGTSNNMINKLHERPIRIILNDYISDFKILLEKRMTYKTTIKIFKPG